MPIQNFEASISCVENGYQVELRGPLSGDLEAQVPSRHAVFLTSYTLCQFFEKALPRPDGEAARPSIQTLVMGGPSRGVNLDFVMPGSVVTPLGDPNE